MLTSEPNLESLEEPEVSENMISRIQWVGGSWNLVLQEQLLNCVVDVMRQITMMQYPTLSLLF
jgi:hypothetical protein